MPVALPGLSRYRLPRFGLWRFEVFAIGNLALVCFLEAACHGERRRTFEGRLRLACACLRLSDLAAVRLPL